MIVTIRPKIRILFANDDQSAEGVESLDKKLILISGFVSAIKYLEKALQYIIFANSSDNDTKIGNTYWSQGHIKVK